MLRGVTRLKTPASLVGMADDGTIQPITDRRVYREMHGYIPVPHSSHRELFDALASRAESEFVVEFGSPAAFLGVDNTFEVRIDMLSAASATDDLMASLRSTGTKLFDGRLGDEICGSSGTVCGIGIVCCDPNTVTVTRLAVQDLLAEFRAEVDALLSVAKSVSVNERASYFGAAYWLSCSLQRLLSNGNFKKIDSMVTLLEQCRSRVLTDRERGICRELLRELKV